MFGEEDAKYILLKCSEMNKGTELSMNENTAYKKVPNYANVMG
jgi:hypothetical protein